MTWGLKRTAALIIGIYLLFCAGLLYWVVIYSGSGDGDTLEHVHSSWLVWSGKIPYKDFFQHHNPLLWYVGAPLVGFYEYSLRAVDAVNMLTVTAFLLMLFYIYRLHRDFLSGRFGGLVATAFCALPQESLYNKDFKPDNFMALALVVFRRLYVYAESRIGFNRHGGDYFMAVVHGACCLERLSGCGGIAYAFICSFSCIFVL